MHVCRGNHTQNPAALSETKNAVYEDMKKVAPGQYNNIYVQHDIAPPNLEYLRSLSNLESGPGPSDFVDALVVAGDMLSRAMEARNLKKFTKKVIMLSTFEGQVNQA